MQIHVNANSCLPSALSDDPRDQRAVTIVVDRQPIATGGQGAIYRAVSVDGRPVISRMVKVFHGDLPSALPEILNLVHQNVNPLCIRSVESLKALPLFLFDGTLSGKTIHGYVMREVKGVCFSDIQENALDRYISLPLDKRLRMSLQFAEGMALLYALTIVHADLNAQNLMIDETHGTLAIIDLDGGAPAKNGSAPLVFGKLEPGWLAPEIFAQLKSAKKGHIEVKVTADLFAVAAGVHHLVFGLSPFFFIKCAADIPKYLAASQWPAVRGHEAVAMGNQNAFDYYEREFAQVPELQKAFRMAFQEGYGNPARRPTAYEWIQALKRQLGAYAPQASVPVQPRLRPPSPKPLFVLPPFGQPRKGGLKPLGPSPQARVPAPAAAPAPGPALGQRPLVPQATACRRLISRGTLPAFVLSLALLGPVVPREACLAMGAVAALLIGRRALLEHSKPYAAAAFCGILLFLAVCRMLLGSYAGFLDGLALGLATAPMIRNWLGGGAGGGSFTRRAGFVWALATGSMVCAMALPVWRPSYAPRRVSEAPANVSELRPTPAPREDGNKINTQDNDSMSHDGLLQTHQGAPRSFPTQSDSGPPQEGRSPVFTFDTDTVLNLRAGPAFEQESVGYIRIPRGGPLEVREQQGNWVKVRVPGNDNGAEGWAYVAKPPGR